MGVLFIRYVDALIPFVVGVCALFSSYMSRPALEGEWETALPGWTQKMAGCGWILIAVSALMFLLAWNRAATWSAVAEAGHFSIEMPNERETAEETLFSWPTHKWDAHDSKGNEYIFRYLQVPSGKQQAS